MNIFKKVMSVALVFMGLSCSYGMEDLPITDNRSGRILDQFREVLYDVLKETHVIPEDIYIIIKDEETGEDKKIPYASILKAIGMTDDDIETGGTVMHRLENIFHMAETNSCKLSHIISSLNAFQQEDRKNMNTLMEELSNLKSEMFTTRAALYAHDFIMQKILSDIGTNEVETSLYLTGKTDIMKEALEKPKQTSFTNYDYMHPIHHCSHCAGIEAPDDEKDDLSTSCGCMTSEILP